jgi:hypothetical protein
MYTTRTEYIGVDDSFYNRRLTKAYPDSSFCSHMRLFYNDTQNIVPIELLILFNDNLMQFKWSVFIKTAIICIVNVNYSKEEQNEYPRDQVF